jgi:hypothetical protein
MRGEKKPRRGATPDPIDVEPSKRGSAMDVQKILDEQKENLRKLKESLANKDITPVEKPKKKPRKKKEKPE